MNRFTVIVCFLFAGLMAGAQQHDANWVFGIGAGIDFSDPQNPVTFRSEATNWEVNAGISDTAGDLLFYLQTTLQGPTNSPNKLRNTQHNILPGGDSISTWESRSNGAMALPSLSDENKYYLLHVGDFYLGPCISCDKLLLSIIELDSAGSPYVKESNIGLSTNEVGEKVTGVKNASNSGWWIYSQYYNPNNSSGINHYYKFFLQEDTVIGPDTINSGNLYSYGGAAGEITVSRNGAFLASALSLEQVVELYGINRCNGNLEFIDSLKFSEDEIVYGLSFSPNSEIIYISTTDYSGVNVVSRIFQYHIFTKNLFHIWQYYHPKGAVNQMELSTDDNIYVGFYVVNTSGTTMIYDSLNTHLGVIHEPDSAGLACDFRPFSFALGDSILGTIGLPNFPNYRLGPLSIYTTSAALDTTFCIEDTTLPATLTLGQPDTSNLQYTWWPQDSFANPNLAQQTINLPQVADTLQYILTIGDSTITNACTSRDDTVTIILKSCKDDTVGMPVINTVQINIHPNPNNGQFTINLNTPDDGELTIYNLQGQQLWQQAVQPGTTSVAPSRPLFAGLYFVRIAVNGQPAFSRKLVVR